MGEFIECFDPSGKVFKVNFTKDTCSQIRVGICELHDFVVSDDKGSSLKYSGYQSILQGLKGI